jgi:release factor glutamine methyltransferase
MATEQAWTLGQLLDWTGKHLAQKGLESPRLDAEVLLAHVVGCKRIDLYGLRHGEEASAEMRQKFKELIRRRIEGAPVAYLVGKKEFYGLDFAVGPAVLIPRPDTENLLTEALTQARQLESPKIVDVGVGSGCVAVTLAKKLAAADVTAIDISADALAQAKANADKHGVLNRIRFMLGDLLAPLDRAAQFDVIASNPPYIATEDIPTLPIGVRDYEPRAALDGGPGGYVILERLAEQAPSYLKSGGFLIVEIGAPQEKRARDILQSHAEFRLGPTIFDHSGHPRVLKAQRR